MMPKRLFIKPTPSVLTVIPRAVGNLKQLPLTRAPRPHGGGGGCAGLQKAPKTQLIGTVVGRTQQILVDPAPHDKSAMLSLVRHV